jgi:C-terminal processing protease CtpA/Prc
MITRNHMQHFARLYFWTLATTFILWSASAPVGAQTLDGFERERGRTQLNTIKNEIKKNYYDPTFHGMDVDARFKAADDKIKQATSVGQMYAIIAQAVLDLNDSHTFYIPPERAARFNYGWQMQMIGNRCYVVAIKPGSDAEAKGLKPGDMIQSVSGFTPTRDTLWKMLYFFNVLRPQPGLHLEVVSPNGSARQVDVMAKITPLKGMIDLTNASDFGDLIREIEAEDRMTRHHYIEMGDDLFIWKMPEFNLSSGDVDTMMDKVKKHKGLLLDLRGNPGGAEDTLKRMLGYFCDHDMNVGEIKGRKETKPFIAKTRGGDAYKGKLVVLIDSSSGSSAEIFARMIQMEKRGTVIGDRSAGAVMRARGENYQLGEGHAIFYGVNVTNADLVMTDGKSLERLGVTPDEALLPTAADLAAKRDPVLARAAAILGVKLEPEKAGVMFPIEWRR